MRCCFALGLLLTVVVGLVKGQSPSGDEIADALYRHPQECKDPSDGGIWAPLPDGVDCGGTKCNFPQEWCSAKAGDESTPDLNCVDLPPDCQKKVQEDLGGGGGGSTPAQDTTAGSQDTTTSSGAVTTTSATTKASTARTTKATTKAAGGATTGAPGATTSSPSNCNDNHPYCCFWAGSIRRGQSECEVNALWMRANCQKSCGTCGCQGADCKVKVNTQDCPYGPGNGIVRVPLGGGGSGPFGGVNQNQGGIVKVPLGGGGTGLANGLGANAGAPQGGIVKVPLGGAPASAFGGNGGFGNVGNQGGIVQVPLGGGNAGPGFGPNNGQGGFGNNGGIVVVPIRG